MIDFRDFELSNINEVAERIYEHNVRQGFYEDFFELDGKYDYLFHFRSIALIHSELSEALEALRFNNKTSPIRPVLEIKDESDFKAAFQMRIKDTFEDGIADTIIRLLDLCGAMQIDIKSHIMAKMQYNKSRPYKHNKLT